MNIFTAAIFAIALIFLNLISARKIQQSQHSAENNTNVYLNTLQIIRKYGYPAESHTVETQDGYFLEIHRIPHGKHENVGFQGKKPPVFIQHGLLGTSADFVWTYADKALPFLLSDLGFDVWLGNVRGNVYSRAHATLFPTDNEFWNFTWHQSAIYDIPAQINFVCNHTNQEKVVYIGFSMGTTMFFVMTSTLPEYNDKIELSLLMAPVAYVKHIKSPLLRFMVPFASKIKALADLVSKGEFFSESKLFKLFTKILCEMNRVDKRLCENVIFSVVGSDPKEFDEKLLPVILGHYPAGYSAKGVYHYSQLVQSGEFRQFDYGKMGNVIEYGTATPPDYNLKKIKAPMYFYEGKNDYLAPVKDVLYLANQLSSLRRLRYVDYAYFTHLDFLVSLHVKHMVYDILIDDLISFLKDDNKIQ